MENVTVSKDKTQIISQDLIQQYEDDGIIKVSVPEEIVLLKKEFLNDCCTFLKKWANFESTPETLVYDLIEIAKTNRSVVGKLYKAAKRFVSTRKLSCHPFFVEIAKQIMNTTLVSCFQSTVVRIDLPIEELTLMPAHQDFPYNQGGFNSITLYLGFSDYGKKNGLISFKKGSHKNGVLKVIETSKSNSTDRPHENRDQKYCDLKTAEKVIEIYDTTGIDLSTFTDSNLKMDEVFIFSQLLLHSSQSNTSDMARITLQLRFDDLFHEESYKRNFPEGRIKDDLFSNNYPEFVV